MKTTKFFASAFLSLALLASCSDDDDASTPPVDEEEPITEFTLRFTPRDNANDIVTLNWEDTNEDEIIDNGEQTVTGNFVTNAIYDAEIELMSGDEDFLEEDILIDQASIDAHFFVYSVTDIDFSMERANDDNTLTNGNKLGVKTIWTAGTTADRGEIRFRLFHESQEVNDDDGFGSASGTDTDIDITFDVETVALPQ